MGWVEGISDATYLMPSAPPEEAFQAFRDHLMDTDNPEADEDYRFNSKLDESFTSVIGYFYDGGEEVEERRHEPLLRSNLSSNVF